MNNTFIKVTIMSPLNAQTVQAEWIEVNTNTGNFIVQPGHTPLITALSSNKDLILGLDNGTKKVIKVLDGILEVTRDSATIFLTNE